FLFVLAVGLIAGTISGIVGTGSSIMLMPVLVYAYGPKEAVPIMAVASVMANFSRILAWWREVDWRACAAYSVTGIPAATLVAWPLLRKISDVRTLWRAHTRCLHQGPGRRLLADGRRLHRQALRAPPEARHVPPRDGCHHDRGRTLDALERDAAVVVRSGREF